MMPRQASSWQLILADLALILFLVTLSALAGEEADGTETPRADGVPPENPTQDLQIAASQSLFRPTPLGLTLDEWLNEQPADPRATLTIFAQYAPSDKDAVWKQAQALAASAAGVAQDREFSVRVVISPAQSSDIYASLAYDAPHDRRPET